MEGSHTQVNSDCRTINPREFIRRSSERGDTEMERQEKKKRSLLKGLRNATPKPPLVRASRRPWDIAETNTMIKVVIRPERNQFARSKPQSASRKATAIEWEKPRCPMGWLYGIPARKPTASASGRIEAIMPAVNRRPDTLRPPINAAAIGTAGWLNIVGIFS